MAGCLRSVSTRLLFALALAVGCATGAEEQKQKQEPPAATMCYVPIDKTLKALMVQKEWPDAKKLLEGVGPGEFRDRLVRDLLNIADTKEAVWDTAPKEMMAAFAKLAVELIQRDRGKAVPKDYVLLSWVNWKAEDKKAAAEWAHAAVKLAEEKPDTQGYRDAAGKFAVQVDAGTLPRMKDFNGWASEAKAE